MSSGWIKLHRLLVDWEWYKTPNMVHFWIHCLIRANHADGRYQGIDVPAGSFLSGRLTLSAETGISEQSIRTCIARLKSTSELTTKELHKNTLFTINSWEKYQIGDDANQQTNQQLTSNQPATNQQLTTNKKNKNDKNDKNERSNTVNTGAFAPPSIGECIEYFELKASNRNEAERFFHYYESNGWKVGKNKMKSWHNAASGWISRSEGTGGYQMGRPRETTQERINRENMIRLAEMRRENELNFIEGI